MKAIIMVMLAVQVAIFLATVATVVTARARANRRRPIWSSFAVALVIISGTSWQIADGHAGQPGADLLAWGSPFLLGMAIMTGLMLIRQRRGFDAPA